MKQVIQNNRSGTILVEELPAPLPSAGFVQVQNAFSLVSAGTERMLLEFAEKNLLQKAQARPDLVKQVLHKAQVEGLVPTLTAAFNRLDQPMELGYSSAGSVLNLGEGSTRFHVGQRVACAGAGHAVHAEVITVPENLLVNIPDSVSFEEAAFTTVAAIAMHGFRLANPSIGESVAVIGLGMLGLLAAQIAKAAGCRVLGIEPNPLRRKVAEELGISTANLEEAAGKAKNFSRDLGIDCILICADGASSDPVELAAHIARDKAKVVALGAVGLNLPRKAFYEKELSVVISRSYGPGRYDYEYEEKGLKYPIGQVRWTETQNLQAVMDLLESGALNVKPLITHIFEIANAPQAYSLIANKTEPSLGVLLKYPEHEQEFANLITLAPASQTKTMNTVTLGVLGAGNYAQAVFLPIIESSKETRRHTIVSANGVSAKHSGEKYGFENASTSDEAVISNPEINTIAIFTQHHLHASQVSTALKNQKHVYCEKPLALEIEALKGIFHQLRENPAILTVGFNRRFAPLAQEMKRFIQAQNQPVAFLYRMNAGFIPPSHWTQDPERGGGRIVGEACHLIDFATYIVGKPPISMDVKFIGTNAGSPNDSAQILLGFDDGSSASLSYLSNGDKTLPKEYCEAYSAGSVAILDDFSSLTLISNGKKQALKQRQDKGHRASWAAFLEAITKTQTPPIAYDQLWAVSYASILAQQGSNSGLVIPPLQPQ